MRISGKGLAILNTFMQSPADKLHGYDLMQAAEVSSGTLYPLLMRFEKEGLLTSEWEEVDPQQEGRPRRRLYRITGQGQRVAYQLLGSPGTAPSMQLRSAA